MRHKHWRAVYNNGTILKQIDGDIENKFGDIDLSQLNKFELVSNNGFIYTVLLNPLRKLIYFVRVTGSFGNGENKIDEVHHIGYEQDGEKHIQKIND